MKKLNCNYWRIVPALSLFTVLFVYIAVQAVHAGGAEPGSSQDPLVTRSYVDNYLQSRTRELQGQLTALQQQINAMEARIAALEGRAPGPVSTPGPGPTPAPQPAPAPSPGSDTEIKLVIGHNTAWLGITARELTVAPYRTPDGVSMVPFRFIGEALGARVDFDSVSSTVSYTTPDHSVILKIGSKQGQVDGSKVELHVPATLVNGTTMVPLRFIGERLGASVHWDEANQAITIKP